uniref:Uncharacterized protein n=1 Tax=Anguilla anguilla TaxID=7936 RepID=A0A0E9TAT9_ANGAN
MVQATQSSAEEDDWDVVLYAIINKHVPEGPVQVVHHNRLKAYVLL